MSALGIMLIGIGALTVWAGFDRVNIFDLLRSFIGAPVPTRSKEGAIKPATKGA